MTVTNTQTFNSVMIGGAEQQLDRPMTATEIQTVLTNMGLGKDFANSTPVETSPGVLSFEITRGENG